VSAAEKSERARYEASLAAVRKNPEVVLTWKLSGQEETAEIRAVKIALQDKTPGFTEELLREVAHRAPILEDFVFYHPSASEAFIRASFDAIMAKAVKGRSYAFPAMIKNPNMPTDLLVRIANADLPYSQHHKYLARDEIERRRKANQTPEPTPPSGRGSS
jgi:hypothetical protein